jgi:hypothetical protein
VKVLEDGEKQNEDTSTFPLKKVLRGLVSSIINPAN